MVRDLVETRPFNAIGIPVGFTLLIEPSVGLLPYVNHRIQRDVASLTSLETRVPFTT